MFSGVESAFIMPFVPTAPTSVSSSATAVVVSSAVEMAVFMRRKRFAPNSWDTSTPVPILIPVATATNSCVIG